MANTGFWQRYMEEEVPLSQHMQLKVESLAPTVLFSAPLAPNQNNKGTAFAGSLHAALSLAGWMVTQNWADAKLEKQDVVLFKSEITFEKPVTGDFKVHAELEPGTDLIKVRNMLERRGRARVNVTGKITEGSEDKVRFMGSYVILSKDDSSS
jgi:thioesterase domain-containing protein